MSEGSPFKIGVIVMPMGPEPKPDSFGILDRDGKSVGWLSLKQVETAMAEWHRLVRKRAAALAPAVTCGECHLKPGEVCNICGATESK